MITSKQNALIKEIRSLSDKKFRDGLNLYIVEGIKTVKEVLALQLPVKVVVATEKGLLACGQVCAKTELVTEEVFKYVSTETTPQGVLAVVEKPENQLLAPTSSCLLLDGVADPNNVGAILRTAVASGYKEVYMTSECADPFSPKAVRCSMSGVFRSKITRGELSEILSVMNLPIIVADMNGENVFTTKIDKEFCLVIGNEGRGVSEKLKSIADITVSIPMENGMESLNASVSAGILMYNLKNTRKGE
jgi:TrmH family RNA methyltransferase